MNPPNYIPTPRTDAQQDELLHSDTYTSWQETLKQARALELEAVLLQKQCEELKERLVRCGPESFRLERDDLHTRANDLECKFNSICETARNERERAEKAEAEVAELKQETEMLLGELRNEKRYHTQLIQLQQDVRPLLQSLRNIANAGNAAMPDLPRREDGATRTTKVHATEALETFLAKHPELA